MHVPQMISKSGKRWKPSRVEVKDSLVTQVANVSGVQPAIEKRREKLGLLKRSLQPFVIAVGDSLTSSSTAFVSVDNILYEQSSVLNAIDITFKIIHALHAQYPEESRDVWMFIQKRFYDIHTAYDRKVNQNVKEMLTIFGMQSQ